MELKGTQWHISARPTKIDEVYGGASSNIDTMLKPFVKMHAKDDKWPNGILLMGKSGGGKTTIAKIIAMTMVCKHKDAEGNPCGECPECRQIIDEKFKHDVQLITVADLKKDSESANEGLSKLIQDSRALPFFGSKYRVIIFDEIQELLRSRGAINELLKELERKDSRTKWIFTSMDTIKATGSTVETELGNGSGYGSSGNTGFLRRLADATFKFTTLETSDLMKYMVNFCKTHIYEGEQTLWSYLFTVLDESTKSFLTEGFKVIAEASVGSIGTALAHLQYCVDNKVFTIPAISKYVGMAPEVKILDAVVSLATNNKSDEAFMQISGITQDNFPTVYQIMMSEIRRAEMMRVFNRIGTLKVKKGVEEFKVIDDHTDGPEKISFNRAKSILAGQNYNKLKKALLELNQEGFFTLDTFKVKLLDVFE